MTSWNCSKCGSRMYSQPECRSSCDRGCENRENGLTKQDMLALSRWLRPSLWSGVRPEPEIGGA